MSKNIQMPVEFLNDVAKLLNALDNEKISKETENIADRVFNHLSVKLDRIKQREAFTAYKTNTGTLDERIEKKEKYIKLKNGDI